MLKHKLVVAPWLSALCYSVMPSLAGGTVDCNGNGTDDAIDITGGGITYSDSPELAIPNNNTGGVSTIILVPDAGMIQDVDVGLLIDHQAQGELKVELAHGGRSVILINRAGSNVTGCGAQTYGYFMDDYGAEASPLDLDDGAGVGVDCYDGPWTGTAVEGIEGYAGPARPTGALADFNGLGAAGEWTLTVSDSQGPYNFGTLKSWSITITAGFSLDANRNGIPDECQGRAEAWIVQAQSRKNCDMLITPGFRAESRLGGLTQLRVAFDQPPVEPGAAPAVIEQKTCAAPQYGPYQGAAAVSGYVVGNEVVLAFAPGLENGRTYRITLDPAVSSIEGQFIELRVLQGDVNGDGFVNAMDRSGIVAAWQGAGFSCPTDLNNDGFTKSTDRSIVVAAWTGAVRCAP